MGHGKRPVLGAGRPASSTPKAGSWPENGERNVLNAAAETQKKALGTVWCCPRSRKAFLFNWADKRRVPPLHPQPGRAPCRLGGGALVRQPLAGGLAASPGLLSPEGIGYQQASPCCVLLPAHPIKRAPSPALAPAKGPKGPCVLGPHPEFSLVGVLQQVGVSQVPAPLRGGRRGCKRQIRMDLPCPAAAAPCSSPGFGATLGVASSHQLCRYTHRDTQLAKC